MKKGIWILAAFLVIAGGAGWGSYYKWGQWWAPGPVAQASKAGAKKGGGAPVPVDVVVAAKKNGIKRFIYASSSSVYGVSDSPDVTEEHPLVPLTLYNKYKGMCEPLLFKPVFTCVNERGQQSGADVEPFHRRQQGAQRPQRQPDPTANGEFKVYKVHGISPDQSFLEMLDVLNEQLVAQGDDPVAQAMKGLTKARGMATA